MGILEKLKPGHKNDGTTGNDKPLYSGNERKSLEQQAGRSSVDRDRYYGNQNTTGLGSGHNSTGVGSNHDQNSPSMTDKLRHPVQSSSAGGQYGSGDAYGNPGRRSQDGAYPPMGREGYQNMEHDGYGQTNTTHKTHAINPVDPRTTKGQNAMADASHHNQGGYGPTGENGRDYDNVDRSQHGGIKEKLHLGGSNKHDDDAIPIAGGQKVGSGANDHHYGRDAAMAGGAAGLGEHEHRRRSNERQHGREGYDQSGSSSSGRNDNQHHYGRDAAITGGVASMGLHEHNKHNDRDERHHGRDAYDQSGSSSDRYGGQSGGTYPQDNSYGDNSRHGGSGLGGMAATGAGIGSGHHGHHGNEGGQTAQGLSMEKKLADAYQEGYAAALRHAAAERQ